VTREHAIELFSGFNSPSNENGSRKDAETLFNRFDDPTGDYAVHSTKNLLLVSSRRKTKGVSYTALCAFFARPSARDRRSRAHRLPPPETARLRLCRQQRPAAEAAGHLPARQIAPADPGALRDVRSDEHDVRFDRFQLIDSDFA